jgi:hypothetical protein
MGDTPSSSHYHPIDTTPQAQLSEVMGLPILFSMSVAAIMTVELNSDAFQEASPAGYGLPGGAQAGWGISQVMTAFVASLAGNRGRGLAPELSQDSLGRVPQGRKDVGETVHHL